MKILVHNDGKEKYESFEAWSPETETIVSRGCGANEQEAIDDYIDNVGKMLDFLQDHYTSRPEEITYVDWKGDKLK